MKRAERQALEARAAVEGFGKDEVGQEFAGIGQLLQRMGNPAQAFIRPAVEMVESNLDSFVGLRSVEPFLADMFRAVPQAPLPSKDKLTVIQALSMLLDFVRKHSSVYARGRQKLKNVAREKVASIKQNFIEDLQNSPNVIKRILGRQFNQRFGEAAQARQKQLLESRATLAASVVPEAQEDFTPERRSSRPTSWESPSPAGGGDSVGSNRTLLSILATDKNILTQVTKLAQAEEDNADRLIQQQEQSERDREGKSPVRSKTAIAQQVLKKTGVSEEASRTKNVLGAVADVFSGAGGLLQIASKLKPALALLGSGALVVGAAFAGWEVGKMIDKWTGASTHVGRVASWLGEKLGVGGFGDAQRTAASQAALDAQHQGRDYNKEAAARAAAQAKVASTRAERQSQIASGNIFVANPPAAMATMDAWNAPTAPTAVPAVPAPATPLPGPAQRVTPTPPVVAAPKVSRAPVAAARGQMEMSEEGFQLLTQREGFPKNEQGYAVAYKDAGGVWSIGYGTTRINGKPVREGMTLSPEEAIAEFRKQVKTEYEPVVRNALGSTPVTQNQFDALVSTAYNHPATARRAGKKLQRGEPLTPEDFTSTATVKGVRNEGLVARRMGEYNQFAGGPKTARAQAPVTMSAGLVPPPATPSFVTPAPPSTTAARAAAPVIAATTAARAGVGTSGAPVVAAPITNIYQTTAQQSTPIPPMIRPKHDNDSLRAIQGVNSIA